MIVGGGKPALPAGFRTHLELLDEHRFNNGVVRVVYDDASAVVTGIGPGRLSADDAIISVDTTAGIRPRTSRLVRYRLA